MLKIGLKKDPKFIYAQMTLLCTLMSGWLDGRLFSKISQNRQKQVSQISEKMIDPSNGYFTKVLKNDCFLVIFRPFL